MAIVECFIFSYFGHGTIFLYFFFCPATQMAIRKIPATLMILDLDLELHDLISKPKLKCMCTFLCFNFHF